MFNASELTGVFRDGPVQTAIETAIDISLAQDKTMVPLLLEILAGVMADQQSGELRRTDAAEERRQMALERAIVCLVPIHEAKQLFEEGKLQWKYAVEHRSKCKTIQEFWGLNVQ